MTSEDEESRAPAVDEVELLRPRLCFRNDYVLGWQHTRAE